LYRKSSTPLFLFVVLLDIALWIVVGLEMGLLGAGLKPVVGYLLYASGWIGVYSVAAMVHNHLYGRRVFPLFGSIVK
jgi:succinate-acetate transporter protein